MFFVVLECFSRRWRSASDGRADQALLRVTDARSDGDGDGKTETQIIKGSSGVLSDFRNFNSTHLLKDWEIPKNKWNSWNAEIVKFQGQPVASNEVASQVIMAEPHQKPLPVGFCGIRDVNRTGRVESCELNSGTKTNTFNFCVQVWDYTFFNSQRIRSIISDSQNWESLFNKV